MRKVFILAGVALLLLTAGVEARHPIGTVFGSLQSAQTIGQEKSYVGGGIGVGDEFTSFFGSFAYGFSKYTEGRIKLGFADPDSEGSDLGLALGGDFKYLLFSVTEDPAKPFDLALGGLFEYVDIDGGSVLHFGGGVIGSYPFRLSNGNLLSPYGRLHMRLERWSWDWYNPITNKWHDEVDTDVFFGLNGGVKFQLSDYVNLYGEFQIDGNDGIVIGIDYNIM